MLKPQTTRAATRAAAPTRLHYAYGVILCHSTYRKLIHGGYVAHETPRDNSQPDMPSKIVSTLLEILALEAAKRVVSDYPVVFQPFLRF